MARRYCEVDSEGPIDDMVRKGCVVSYSGDETLKTPCVLA